MALSDGPNSEGKSKRSRRNRRYTDGDAEQTTWIPRPIADPHGPVEVGDRALDVLQGGTDSRNGVNHRLPPVNHFRESVISHVRKADDTRNDQIRNR